MRIGELARRTGMSQRALRYYEEQGLLRPSRQPSGYREFAEDDVEQVRRVRLLLAAGLSTGTIAQIMPCMVEDNGALTPACAPVQDGLLEERAKMSTAIAELQAARDLLDDVIGTRISDPASCAVS